MKLHANARTCFHCRSLIVSRVIDKREAPSAVADEFRVTPRTVHRRLMAGYPRVFTIERRGTFPNMWH
jgi:hypothetical protein